MHLCKRFLFYATLSLLCHVTPKAFAVKTKFTNAQCEPFDKAFATFKTCYLKAIARHQVALYVHLQLHQVPVTSTTLNAGFYQKGNGYRPYLYNTTIDFSAFLLRPSRYMFWKILFEAGVKSSNVNHSCPYSHDIIINGLILNGDMLKLVPFPSNDYQTRFRAGDSSGYKMEVRYNIKLYD